MRAMILAAGRGARMRDLTARRPKPLLEAGGRSLIEWQIDRLRAAGIHDLVINTGWQGKALHRALRSGASTGVTIRWSDEGWPALETAGGIRRALPLLGSDPFLVVNADLWCNFDLASLRDRPIDAETDAHLVLVDNPAHHAEGDFAIRDQRLRMSGTPKFTYSGIGLFHPRMFENLPAGPLALRPVLEAAIESERVAGEYFGGTWMDIGSPERLAELDRRLSGAQRRIQDE